MASAKIKARRQTKRDVYDGLKDIVMIAPRATTGRYVLNKDEIQQAELKITMLASRLSAQKKDVLKTGKGLKGRVFAEGKDNFYKFIFTDISGCGAHIVEECFLWAQKISSENPHLKLDWNSFENRVNVAVEAALVDVAQTTDEYKADPSRREPRDGVEKSIWAHWKAYTILNGPSKPLKEKQREWVEELTKQSLPETAFENLVRRGIEKSAGKVQSYYNHLVGMDSDEDPTDGSSDDEDPTDGSSDDEDSTDGSSVTASL